MKKTESETKKQIMFFCLNSDEGIEVQKKLKEAKEAIEANGYEIIEIFAHDADEPTLLVEDYIYPYTGSWIDTFIYFCKEQFVAKKRLVPSH